MYGQTSKNLVGIFKAGHIYSKHILCYCVSQHPTLTEITLDEICQSLCERVTQFWGQEKQLK